MAEWEGNEEKNKLLGDNDEVTVEVLQPCKKGMWYVDHSPEGLHPPFQKPQVYK